VAKQSPGPVEARHPQGLVDTQRWEMVCVNEPERAQLIGDLSVPRPPILTATEQLRSEYGWPEPEGPPQQLWFPATDTPLAS
jgi:hypothetical protein